jgi:predicted AAA+ superfamily ATPase
MENYIERHYGKLDNFMRPKYITSIYGPRRTGKTTLVNRYLDGLEGVKILRAVGDDITVRNVLSSENASLILDWAGGYDIVFIDEAQRVPKIGWGLKILIDARPDLKIIVTGSASFDLASRIGAPLTGRQSAVNIFPISVGELAGIRNNFELKQGLPHFLVYGMYPEILTADDTKEKRRILRGILSAYLFKDILEVENVKNSKLLLDLLTLIAYHTGGEVSMSELAARLGVNARTIARYLDLFEKSFILYNLRGFSRNLRSEVTKTSKYYFYDNGIRSAVIGDFNPPESRGDLGALWENFMIMERLKYRGYSQITARDYFWRTWERQEIDLIEDAEGSLFAYEFKFSPRKSPPVPKKFREAYPHARYEAITSDNFIGFITDGLGGRASGDSSAAPVIP